MMTQYPVLLYSPFQRLTADEKREFKALLAARNSLDEKKQFRLSELRQKSKTTTPLLQRIPIIFDGETVPAIITSTSITMNKSFQIIDNEVITNKAMNVNTINILVGESKTANAFLTIITAFIDKSFSSLDEVPAVSFFDKDLIITDGYLIGCASSKDSNSTATNISLSIARELGEESESVDIVGLPFEITEGFK